MATEKIINTRIQLKYDTLENWNKVQDTFIPKKGELIVIYVPASSGSVVNEPAVLFKVGDGTSKLSALSYTSAVAADVYAWAKASTKPSYSAEEIEGLEEYIGEKTEDTNTTYKLEQDESDGHKLILSKQEKGSSLWTTVAEIETEDTVYDDSTVKADIKSLQDLVGDTAVATQIATAIANLKLGETYATKTEVEALKEQIGDDSVEDQIAEAIDGLGEVYQTKEDAASDKSDLLGSDSDVAGTQTIHGANKAAADAKTAAEAKVASVDAKDKSITVDNTDPKNPKLSVNLDPATTNALKLGENGLNVTIPDAATISVVEATAAEGALKSYKVTVNGEQVGVTIDVPKDFLVKSAKVDTVTAADKQAGGKFADNEEFAVGDKYIDFTINVKEGTATDEHIYLNVKDLAHVYTAGQGIAISTSDVISIKIDTDNANGLAITDAGLKLTLATTEAAGAMSAADKTKLEGIATGAQVNVIETIKVNGTAQTPTEKAVDITVPTGALADKDEVSKTDLDEALQEELDGKADASDLATVATTGKAEDLIFDGVVLVLNCGSSTENV